MRYTLQEASFKAIVKIEKSLLSTIYSKRRLIVAFKYQDWIVWCYLIK